MVIHTHWVASIIEAIWKVSVTFFDCSVQDNGEQDFKVHLRRPSGQLELLKWQDIKFVNVFTSTSDKTKAKRKSFINFDITALTTCSLVSTKTHGNTISKENVL